MYDNKFAEEQGRMLAVERRNLILEKLQNERKVVVSELSALFDVSEETIRRGWRLKATAALS